MVHTSRMTDRTRSEHYSGGFPESIEAFNSLSHPRTGRHPHHYFGEIIFMALAAIICQCEGFDDMARFAKLKERWLKKILKLPHGTPSNDTFRRVFFSINVEQFTHYTRKNTHITSGSLH